MSPKRTAPVEPEASNVEQFWAVPEGTSEHRKQLGEQISRLQQKQLDLVQETARELEELKRQLEDGKDFEEHVTKARQPLLEEIATLRAQVSGVLGEKEALEEQIARLQSEYRTRYTEVQGALGSLQDVVRNQVDSFDEQLKAFAVEAPVVVVSEPKAAEPVQKADDKLEALLADFAPPEATAPTFVEPVQEEPAPRPKKEKRERQPRSFTGFRRFALRTVALAILVLGGYTGLKAIQKKNLTADGQVAGVSTTAPTSTPAATDDPADRYKESFVVVPFEQTDWETYTDPDLGFGVRYPKNTSDLVKTVGGSNVWFLRFDSYLLKVSTEDSRDTLDAWWDKSKGFYLDDAVVTKGVFKGRPAYIVTQNPTTKTPGTTYIVATKTGVMEIWAQSIDPKTDDGQRVSKMLDSFTISN